MPFCCCRAPPATSRVLYRHQCQTSPVKARAICMCHGVAIGILKSKHKVAIGAVVLLQGPPASHCFSVGAVGLLQSPPLCHKLSKGGQVLLYPPPFRHRLSL